MNEEDQGLKPKYTSPKGKDMNISESVEVPNAAILNDMTPDGHKEESKKNEVEDQSTILNLSLAKDMVVAVNPSKKDVTCNIRATKNMSVVISPKNDQLLKMPKISVNKSLIPKPVKNKLVNQEVVHDEEGNNAKKGRDLDEESAVQNFMNVARQGDFSPRQIEKGKSVDKGRTKQKTIILVFKALGENENDCI